jgi:hypothetical protein
MNEALLGGIEKLFCIWVFSYITGNALAELYLYRKRKKKLIEQQRSEQ